MVTQNWQEREVEAGQPQVFHIHEQDRAMIRDAIVDAMVHAPELVRLTTNYQIMFVCDINVYIN